MAIDWTPLRQELARYRAAGTPLPLWWRDDDAIAPSPALDQLTALADQTGLPVHLAIIPKFGSRELAQLCLADPMVIPVVHGWAHENHAPSSAKKAEFNHRRAGLKTDAAQALARMTDLFGPRVLPMFVPPWNRIAAELIPTLPDMGYLALSTFTPRAHRYAAPGLVQINTHLDPIHWRGGGGLVPAEDLLAQMVHQLQARREGRSDAQEPYGLLTHHLVHDAAVWQFTERCILELLDGGALPVNLAQDADLDVAPIG